VFLVYRRKGGFQFSINSYSGAEQKHLSL